MVGQELHDREWQSSQEQQRPRQTGDQEREEAGTVAPDITTIIEIWLK